MVGDRLEYLVLNSEGGESYNKDGPLYTHPEALVLYEAESDTLDYREVYTTYDVYPNPLYRPAFSSMHAFRNFQLTRNVNDTVHMYLFCQFSKIWTYSVAP